MDPSVLATVPEGLHKRVEENFIEALLEAKQEHRENSLGDAEHTSIKQPTIKPSTTQAQHAHERRRKDKGRKPRRRTLGAAITRPLRTPCSDV